MTRHLLSVQSIFENVSGETLDGLCEAGTTVVLEGGDVLIQEGDRVENIYCILSGEVDILVPDDLEEHEDLTWINMLVEGECIGEYSFVDNQLASATVRARTRTELFQLPHSAIHNFMDADIALRAQIYRNLLESLVQRLRNTNIYIDYLQRDKPERPVMI